MRRTLEPSGHGHRELLPLAPLSPDYLSRYGTEEACRDFLFRSRWPDGFQCHDCSNRSFRWEGSKSLVCLGCHTKWSLTAGTILHRTRKPLRDWFVAAYYIVQRGANARTLQRLVGLTYKVAWMWAHKLRRVLKGQTTLPTPARPFDRGRWRALHRTEPHTNVLRRWFGVHGHFEWDANRPGGLGRCCARLTKVDWSDPKPDEPDRFALSRTGVLISFAKWWLFRAYSGSLADKHLRAYLDETEFRLNRRDLPPSEAAIELVELFASTPPHTYRDITGAPAPGEPLRFWGPPLQRIPATG
jgi:hypothetical protein